MTSVFAADDSVIMTSIATSTACQLECRIRREDCPGLPQTQPFPHPGHEIVHATVDLDAVDSMPSGNTLRPESSEFWQSPSLAAAWPLEIDVSMWPNHPLEHLQDIAQQVSTLLSFVLQSCSLAWLHVEILYGRPCSAWNRHPDPTGGQLLDLFENFRHTPLLVEIVPSFQCQPLGMHSMFLHVVCDGALRIAAHLPDARCAAATTAAIAATAATAATAVVAGRGVRAAAGACST